MGRKAREKDPDKIKAALARICELEPISAEQCPLDHDDVWHGSFASSPLVKSAIPKLKDNQRLREMSEFQGFEGDDDTEGKHSSVDNDRRWKTLLKTTKRTVDAEVLYAKLIGLG